MINEKFFLGLPQEFHNKCKIYSPTIKEIIVNDNFTKFKAILTISQEEIEDDFVKNNIESNEIPTPFEYLLATSYHNKNFERLAYAAFQFFIKEPVTFIYDQKKILIGNLLDIIPKLKDVKDLKKLKYITEDEYFDFQNQIRLSLGENAIEPPNPDEDPRIKRIKAKARYRDKIKAKKNLGINLGTTLASICCMGIGITPLNIGDLNYVMLHNLMSYYQEKEKYELDMNALMSGADSKKIKPKYWIRNLE